MPADWKGTTKESLVRCLSSNCNNNDQALQPYAMNCPNSYVECQQNDVKLELQKSGIDTATIENKCGAIDFGAAPAPSQGGAAPPSAAPPTPTAKKGLSKTAIYGIAGGSAAVILIVIIIVVVVIAGKKKKAAVV